MKTQHRHQLKQNDFAATMSRAVGAMRGSPRRVVVLFVVILILTAGVGGFFTWRKQTRDRAGAMFAEAMATTEAQIAPAPTVPGATQAPGTFPSVKARQEASLAAFQKLAVEYPSIPDGIAAAYHVAGSLFALGRFPEAEQAYWDVITRAGTSSLYGAAARMGLAQTIAAQGQYDRAIKEYTDLAAQRDGVLPVDGILVELARTYLKAGKTSDARATFKRVVDEFPDSSYVMEARQQMALLG